MKLTYDSGYNIAYLKLPDKSAMVESIKISEELNIDIAPDGTVYGIELLRAYPNINPSRQDEFILTIRTCSCPPWRTESPINWATTLIFG